MPRTDGRPPRLTPERQQRLVNSVTAGNTLRAASETADLGYTTVKRYLARGQAAQTIVENYLTSLTDLRRAVLDRWPDTKLTTHLEARIPERERVYWHLWAAVTRARALAEEGRVLRVAEAGAGYQATETHRETKEVLRRNAEGVDEVVTLTTVRTVQRFVRDWRADWAWLQARNREDWTTKQAVELSGGETPVVVETVDQKKQRAMQQLDELEKRRQENEARDAAQAAFDAEQRLGETGGASA